MGAKRINTVFVTTGHGDRSFSLVHGDLADEAADLVVFSAHAGRGRPAGQVLDALEQRHGRLEIDSAGQVISLAGNSPFRLLPEAGFHGSPAGVYDVTPPSNAPFGRLLLVRLPGAQHFDSEDAAIEAYGRAVRGTFAAIAALEFVDARFATISLPALGGARRFPKIEAITLLLDAALNWLRMSRYAERIRFVVQDECDLNAWSLAMDESLGRTFACESDYGGAAMELRARLTEQIAALLQDEDDEGLKGVLRDAGTAMARPETELAIQQVGVLGRLTAEAMAVRLCRDLEIAPGKNAFGNIEQLERSGIISKWINSYLHSLRILGNESVHLAERHQRIPKVLAVGDLIVILSNMVRVLDFYSLWRNQRDRESASKRE